MTKETRTALECYACGKIGGYDVFGVPTKCPQCGSESVHLPEAHANWAHKAPKPYTWAQIDAATITKAGREMFYRLPRVTQDCADFGRVATILSLMVRNGKKAWTATERQNEQGGMYAYWESKAQRETDPERKTEYWHKADKAGQQYVAKAERDGSGAEARLGRLVEMLSEITGQSWKIGSAGAYGHGLIIPSGLKDYRSDCTVTDSNGHGLPAIFLSGE